MCPKPFSWAKNKRNLFFDGKSRGPLLSRVALKKVLLASRSRDYDDDDNNRYDRVHHSCPRHKIVAMLISSASVGALSPNG